MSELQPPQQVRELMGGFVTSAAVYTATVLGLPDLLAGEPQTAEDLAASSKTHGPSMRRLLRALAARGVVTEQPDGRFASTPVIDALREDAQGSMRNFVLMLGEEHYRAFGELPRSIRTGQPAFPEIYGEPYFDYLGTHPEPSDIFNRAMTDVTTHIAGRVIDAYDFSQLGLLADVGGGNGTLLAAIAAAMPGLRGIVFDLPSGVSETSAFLARAGVSDRVEISTGSFFDALPFSADACILKNIIHDWDDEACVTILRRCREAIGAEGRVLVVERIVPPRIEPSYDNRGLTFTDLIMLVVLTGKERTEQEFRALFEAGGLRLERVVNAGGDLAVIEGVPV